MVLNAGRGAKNRWGNLAYILNAINTLANPPRATYRMNLDGLQVEVDGISCMIANSGNVGLPGIDIAPGMNVSDGLLDIIIIRKGNLPALISVATAAILDSAREPEPLLHWQARKIQIATKPSLQAQADGEEISPTPLQAHVIPKATRIICPPISPDATR